MEVAFHPLMPSVKDSEEAWSIPDVYLLTKRNAGSVAIPHLALTFGTRGIELAKLDGEVVWRCTWSKLDELSTAERTILPGGRQGVVVVIAENGGRRHRLVLPTYEPDAMEASVRARADAHHVRTHVPPPAVSRRLTLAVVVATIATLAVLFLSAAHVLHF